MAKNIEEIKEDLRLIRAELYQNAEVLDAKLVASFVDRLMLSLEELADRIEGVEISVEELSTSECSECQAPVKEAECVCPCCCGETPAKKTKKKAKKAAKPKKKRKK
jgi:hypothetical protein